MTDLVHRHLSCIMFTDMVGYSALAQRDEALGLELVAEQRALLRPVFAAHGGREIKSTGDGFLVEFASALEAVRCAVELQRALVDRNASVSPGKWFQIRVGLHLGDIEVQEGDVFGDGVNVAARIQQCAPTGGICVSGTVADAVRNKIEHPLEPMGGRRLKNIAAPVELYRIVLPWEHHSRWTRVRAAARYRGRVYVEQSRHEEAIRAFEELDRRGQPGSRATLAYAHAMAGNRSEAQRILAEVEGQTEFIEPMATALAHTALGDFDQAFMWLERAYRERSLQPWQLQGPAWDPIRDDPRFVDLLHRMGLEPARPPDRRQRS